MLTKMIGFVYIYNIDSIYRPIYNERNRTGGGVEPLLHSIIIVYNSLTADDCCRRLYPNAILAVWYSLL